jgi:hypothetical protein
MTMETTVTKITRVEIKNRLGQRLQLDPDEAQALSAKLPAILEDMGIDTGVKRRAPAAVNPDADKPVDHSRRCGFCGGVKADCATLCGDCHGRQANAVREAAKAAHDGAKSPRGRYDAVFRLHMELERAKSAAAGEWMANRKNSKTKQTKESK